jgi:MauM/NapG family ferredoxin protein
MDRRDFFKQAAALGLGLGGAAYVSGLHTRRAEGAPLPLRPPGALPEDDFTATCIRCMRCVDACPNHALLPLGEGDARGPAGTPALSPRTAPCILCSSDPGSYLRCTEVCPSGALQLVEKTRAMVKEKVHIGVAEVDTGLCYSYNNWSCGACFRACPLAGEAMTVGTWERPIIHPEACIGCGCCERACIRYPHAIRVHAEGEGT